jgi:hypothetical protein
MVLYIDLSILEEFATPFDREACEFLKEAPLTASLRKRMLFVHEKHDQVSVTTPFRQAPLFRG